MKMTYLFCAVAPLAFAVFFTQAAEMPRLVASSPGQVFTERESVTFAATAPVSAAHWTLRDWARAPLRQGDWPADGRLSFGTLPKGYYFVTLEGASPSVREGSFCVVPEPSARRATKDVPYGIDAALSWVCSPRNFATAWYGTNSYFACLELIRRCGVTHLRERLRPEETSHRPGEFNGGRYLENARRAQELGLTVSGMFHSMPIYSRRGDKRVDDLRAVFDFCRQVGVAFGDAMGDWEFWNEQDIPSFWLDSAWNYAAALKAAYLGFKAANPEKPVLNGAFCTKPGLPFQQCVYRNGLAHYSDIYNVHYYGPPATYGRHFDQIRAALTAAGCPDRCVWMTECSTQLEGESVQDGLAKGCKAHSYEQELVLAEVYAKGRIGFQMQGVARDYFFVFGAHNERAGIKDWGIQRRDGSVKPVYAAISAMTERLGAAKLVGEMRVGEKAKCFVFAQPDGSQTVAAWSVSPVDTRTAGFVDLRRQKDLLPTTLTLAAADGPYAAANWCGTPLSLTATGGRLAVPVTRYVTFVDGLHGLTADVPAIPPGKVGAAPFADDVDPTVVLQASFDPADVDLAASKASVEIKPSCSSARLVATAWNLSDRPKRGKLSFGGVVASCDGGEWTLPAWGRVAVTTEVSLAAGSVAAELTLGGRFDGRRALPLVAGIKDPNVLHARCDVLPLAAERADFWVRNDSAATMTVAWDAREKALRFDMDWTSRPGVDRWFYPRHVFAKGEPTLDGAVAVEYEARIVQNKVENDIRHALMMFEMPQGDAERVDPVAYTPPTVEWHTVRVPLTDDMGKPVASGATGFKLGFNPLGTKCSYWIRNLRILRSRSGKAPCARRP